MILKILSLNTALLSAFFGLIDIQANLHNRAIMIKDAILSYPDNVQPDIICFQEIFNYNIKH